MQHVEVTVSRSCTVGRTVGLALEARKSAIFTRGLTGNPFRQLVSCAARTNRLRAVPTSCVTNSCRIGLSVATGLAVHIGISEILVREADQPISTRPPTASAAVGHASVR